MAANTGGQGVAVRSASPRRTRANGEQSRQRILDAATEVATERGYEGTTHLAGQQEERPAADLDLLAFRRQGRPDRRGDRAQFPEWLAALELPSGQGTRERAIELGTQVAKALLDAPDFLRLGLMLALEQPPR